MVNYLKGSLNDTDHRAGSAATTSFWDEVSSHHTTPIVSDMLT